MKFIFLIPILFFFGCDEIFHHKKFPGVIYLNNNPQSIGFTIECLDGFQVYQYGHSFLWRVQSAGYLVPCEVLK